MPEGLYLDDAKKATLDNNVKLMFSKGASKEEVLAMSQDFMKKFGEKKKEQTTGLPASGGSLVSGKSKADAIAESKSLGTPTGEQFTYAPESFSGNEVKYAPTSKANKPIVKKPEIKPKEEYVYYEPDIYADEGLMPKSLANKPKEEVSKPSITNDEFTKRISTITPELTSKEEEYTVPQLNYQFKDFGFTFEETGLRDAVSITAPNGKKITISLGGSSDKDLKKFIKDNGLQYDKLSKSISNQENYNKTFVDRKEIETSFAKIQQEQNDFSKSVQELYTIPKDTEEYKVKLSELQKKQAKIEGSKKDLSQSVGKYVAMKSEQGETSEYLWNQLMEGLSGAASGTAGLMIDAFAPSNMSDAEKKSAKKWLQPILRESLDFAKSESTTKEYAANVGFVEGAIGGLVKSLPVMLAAEGMPLVMAAQISDDLDVQMDSDPNFKNISENEKLMLKFPMMIGGAVLETYGFRDAIGTKGLLNDLVASAIGKSTKSTTTKTFKEFIEQDIENRIAKGAIKIGAGGLAEFETGASQELLDITTKEIYNAAKGKDMFQTPNTFGEDAKQVIKAGLQEAIGGFILTTPSAVSSAYKKNNYKGVTDGQIEVLKNLGNDVNIMSAIETDLQNKVNLGDLTPKEAEEQLSDTRETVGLLNSTDTEGMTNEQIKEVLPLVKDLQDLENKKEGLNSAQSELVKLQIDKLKEKIQGVTHDLPESDTPKKAAPKRKKEVKPIIADEKAKDQTETKTIETKRETDVLETPTAVEPKPAAVVEEDIFIDEIDMPESGSSPITPEGFTNRVFESNMQLGEPSEGSHISETGYNYRVLSKNEIDAISESGGVLPREGKQKGGNKNTKYWTKGNKKNWYGDKENLETIRVKDENFKENEVVKAENVEVYNKETGKFEPLIKPESVLSKESASTDNLIRKAQSFNALSKYQKGTKNGLLIQRQISELAAKNGVDITITNPKTGSIKLTKEGKQIKHTPIVEDVETPSEEAIIFAKQMIKQGAVDQWIDIGIPPAEIKKAVDDVKRGKMTKPAKVLINALNERQADNGFTYTEKGIDGSKRSVFVSFDEIADMHEESIREAESLSEAEQDALYEEYQSLGDQELNHIYNLFNDETETITKETSGSSNAVNQEGDAEIEPTEKGLTPEQQVQKGIDQLKDIVTGKGGVLRDITSIPAEILEALGNIAVGYAKMGVNGLKEFIATIRKDEVLSKYFKVATDKELEDVFNRANGVEIVAENPKEVKKTVSTIRAYEGQIREGVKRELEKLGLTREIESQSVAKARAKAFVESVGEEAALDAVRNNDVEGASAAYIWDDALQSVGNKLILEKNPDEVNRLEKLQAKLFNEFEVKARKAGQFSSSLNDIYQNSETIAYNVEKRIQKYKDANFGEISPEIEAKFRDLDKQYQEVRKKLAEAEKRAKKAEDEATITNIKESAQRQQKTSTKIRKDTDWIVSKVKEAKIHRPGMFAAATPASLVWDGAVETVSAAIKITGRSAEAIAKGVEYVKGSDWYKSLTAADKKTAIKQFNDFWSDRFTPRIADGKVKIPDGLIYDLVEGGADTIEKLVSAVKEIMIEDYPDITDRGIRDAITEYGKTRNLNRDEIATEIRKIKRIGRIVSALEDVNAKKRPLRSGVQRDKLDAQERALVKELREAMKELPIDEALEAEQQKNATDAAKTRITNQIEDLQREIDKGEQVPRKIRTVKDDAELIALKAKRDKLKAEHEAIFKDEEYKQAKRLETTKKNTQRRIEDLQRRLKEGDFSKKAKTPLIKDSELTKLRAEKLRIQDEYDKELYKVKLKNRTTVERVKDTLWELWAIPRVLMATGEFSFVLIQGLKQSIAHPTYAAKAFKNAFLSFKSEKNTEKFLNQIKAQDWYPTLKDSKLALTETKAEITAREELFYSGWTNIIWDNLGKLIVSPFRFKSKESFDKAAEGWSKLNPFKAIERASVGYLDTIRVMRFLDGMNILETQGKTFDTNPQDYKDVADAINTLTGRASLGKAEQFAPTLSKVFFSPRNWASGIKTATPYALYHFGKMTPTARKMAISDFSKYLGLTTSMMMLAAAYLNDDDDDETSVEFDPRSSDFMKIKLGDTRVDPWGGTQQQVVLSARMMAWALTLPFIAPNALEGAYKRGDKIMPLGIKYKSPTAFKLLGQQAVNKLNPTASVAFDFLASNRTAEGKLEDDYGNEISAKNVLQDKFNPIFWGTVGDLLKDDSSALDGLLTFYAFFGGGVNVYDNKSKKSQTPQKRTPRKKRERAE